MVELAELLAAVAAVLVAVAAVVRAMRGKAPPAPPVAPALPAIPPARDSQAPSSRSIRRVLVVDDDPAATRAMRALLSSELPNVAIDIEHSGADAIEALADRPCDLLVIDVMMSGVSGPEVVRHLRTAWPGRHTPVILYSGLDPVALEAVRVACGADVAIGKGGDVREVAEAARGLLRGA